MCSEEAISGRVFPSARSSITCVCRFVSIVDLPLDIPDCFLEILNKVAFITGTPKVLDCVSTIERKMLDDVNTLNTRRMLVIMLRVVYLIIHTHVFIPF